MGKKFVERKGLEGGEEVQNVISNLIDHLIATGDINPRTASNDIRMTITQDEMVREQGQEMEDPNAWKPKDWNLLEEEELEEQEDEDD